MRYTGVSIVKIKISENGAKYDVGEVCIIH